MMVEGSVVTARMPHLQKQAQEQVKRQLAQSLVADPPVCLTPRIRRRATMKRCYELAWKYLVEHSDVPGLELMHFIPTEVGYTGGAWNLQIFHWKAGVTPFELSKDDDIAAAAAAGLGTIEVTPILVRCPLVNFAARR